MKKAINAHYVLKPGENIDSALKKFNSKIMESKILDELRDRERYLKPSARKRLERLRAKQARIANGSQ